MVGVEYGGSVATIMDISVTSGFYFPFGSDGNQRPTHPAAEKGDSKCDLG